MERTRSVEQTALDLAAEVLDTQTPSIINRWLDRVTETIYSLRPDLSADEFRNAAPSLVHGVADALRRGMPGAPEVVWVAAAQQHARARRAQGEELADLVREYQILGEVAWSVLSEHLPDMSAADLWLLGHAFTAALDTLTAISVGVYGQAEREATLAAKQTEQRLTSLLESITAAVITLDREGRITYANSTAEQLSQRSREEMIGRPTWEVFAEGFTPDLFREYERTAVERIPTSLEVYYPPLGIWVEVHASPWPDGMVLLITDISERKRAEQEREEALAHAEQARAEAEQAGQQIASILERITDAFFAVDAQARLTYVNQKAVDIWSAAIPGIEREQLIGRSIWEVFPQFVGSEMQGIYEEIIANQEPFALEFYYEPTDAWINIRAYPTEDGLTAYFEDITNRKRAEAERDRLLEEVQRRAAEMDAILGSMADGLAIMDANGNLVRVNEAGMNIARIPPEDRDKPMDERWAMVRPETPDGKPLSLTDERVSRALQYGETTRGVIAKLHPRTGETVWVSVSAAPIRGPHGEIAGIVFTFSDITAQHNLQEQREDLLRTVSHDLRNPLAGVLGQAQLCERRLAKAGMERERESAQTIISAAQRMDTMIQDLVDVARSEAGQIRLERQPVDMRTFTLDLKQRLAASLETARIDVQVPEGLPPASADPARLERILTNLWSNALKYSAPGTPVTVNARQEGNRIITSITDRGPGIPPEELPRLFERYYRAETARQQRGGVGLGLYTARTLVEAHGGRIWAESTVGVGSTFSFSLPIHDASASP